MLPGCHGYRALRTVPDGELKVVELETVAASPDR